MLINNTDVFTPDTQGDRAAEIELLPCPFCGSPAELIISRSSSWGLCTSLRCYSAGPRRATPLQAARAWNTRQALKDPS